MKPVDMVVAAKLVSVSTFGTTYAGLADALGISASEAHASSKRLVESQLFKARPRQAPYPRKQALLEFCELMPLMMALSFAGLVLQPVQCSQGGRPANQQATQPDAFKSNMTLPPCCWLDST